MPDREGDAPYLDTTRMTDEEIDTILPGVRKPLEAPYFSYPAREGYFDKEAKHRKADRFPDLAPQERIIDGVATVGGVVLLVLAFALLASFIGLLTAIAVRLIGWLL